MQGILNDLYGIIRPETCQNPLAALDIILQAMELHLTESHIQISGRWVAPLDRVWCGNIIKRVIETRASLKNSKMLKLILIIILIICSASLFYIAKSPERSLLNVRVKRKTISVLLKAMDMHSDDPTMMRNGCLTLSQFKIPQDVVRLHFRLSICRFCGLKKNF